MKRLRKAIAYLKGNIRFSTVSFLGIGFILGVILGYIAGYYRALQYILNIRFTRISLDFSWLSNVTPNPTFLSDVAAFEAAIIAFLVPLSIEIISKISERYNSDVIIRTFERHWANRILAPFLLLNIVAAVILRFLVVDSADSTIWKIIGWMMLVIFVGVAYAIWRVINRIKVFISNTKSVINELYRNVEESLQ